MAHILGLYHFVLYPKPRYRRCLGRTFFSILLAFQYYLYAPVLCPFVLPRSAFIFKEEILSLFRTDLSDFYRLLSPKAFPYNDNSHNTEGKSIYRL